VKVPYIMPTINLPRLVCGTRLVTEARLLSQVLQYDWMMDLS